jgi:hypothetical protein
MQADAEATRNRLSHVLAARGRCAGEPLLREVKDLAGAFMGALRASPAWDKACDPTGLKGSVRFVESLSTRPKGRGGRGDGQSVYVMAAQHLVLDLHAITPIEKLMSCKRFILDGLGLGIERA